MPLKYSDKELIAKLKFTIEDIKTLPLQAKCIWKMINQEPNAIAYGGLGYVGWLKATLGAKKISKLMFKLIKVIFK